ncbi:MAG: permease prefix domain 1-containing protein [Actinomycetota bacterium]|nr:permease prefix domain 1-containing protein [Actinomycetota bacterium]
MDVLESQITQWRAAVTRNRAVDTADVEELEEHLREQVGELESTGLSEEEAFLVAVKRLGAVDLVTAEFAREHGDRLWKQLVLTGEATGRSKPMLAMLAFAAVAAVGIQIARLASGDAVWFSRDLGLFVLPVLAAYLVSLRRPPRRHIVVLASTVAVLAVVVNVFPFSPDSQTGVLVGIHLPVVLWFVVGAAYLGGEWMSSSRRMDFVRFTGEWAIYYVLIALGGGVLMALTSLVLAPIVPGRALGDVYLWVIPSGAAAALIVAAWLVEAKKSVIENIAPVLTAIFTPLFAVMLLVAVVGYLIVGVGHSFNRDLLIGFDALLIVVLALVLYGISARDSLRPVGVTDALRLVTLVAAVLLDLLVLGSVLGRIGDYGFTPNRVTVLAVNLILLVNLAGTAWLTARAIAARTAAVKIDRWQTGYLPVFGAWGLVAAIVLPLAFWFA